MWVLPPWEQVAPHLFLDILFRAATCLPHTQGNGREDSAKWDIAGRLSCGSWGQPLTHDGALRAPTELRANLSCRNEYVEREVRALASSGAVVRPEWAGTRATLEWGSAVGYW